jgi:hypothetical protein
MISTAKIRCRISIGTANKKPASFVDAGFLFALRKLTKVYKFYYASGVKRLSAETHPGQINPDEVSIYLIKV